MSQRSTQCQRPHRWQREWGLTAGWALDLCNNDYAGKPWDPTKVGMMNKAARKVIDEELLVRIGSPPCTDWSGLTEFQLEQDVSSHG